MKRQKLDLRDETKSMIKIIKRNIKRKMRNNASKVNIIHLKKKQLQKSSSIDNNTATKKIKKKMRDRNSTKSDVGLTRNSNINLAKIQKELSDFNENKNNDKPLKRDKPSLVLTDAENIKVHSTCGLSITPLPNSSNLLGTDPKDLVISDNHPNPKIGQMSGVDCLSIIKDEDTTLKLSEINICPKDNLKINCNKNCEDSDFLNDSNISQYFMANPVNEKTSSNEIDYHNENKENDANRYSNNEHNIKKGDYGTCTAMGKDDWTMDVPKIKYNDEQLSDSSDI